jgi:transposase InsO family protein
VAHRAFTPHTNQRPSGNGRIGGERGRRRSDGSCANIGCEPCTGYRTRRWSVGKPAILIPNLLQRQFTVTKSNKAWVTDITYIRTWQGWLYVAVVMVPRAKVHDR